MSLRKFISAAATLAAFVIVMAAFLSAQDTPYPMLENLDFGGWLLLSAGIVAVIMIPGLAIFGIVIVAKWLLAIAFQRRPDSDPTQPSPPAPAALTPAELDAEWADIEREIKGGSR